LTLVHAASRQVKEAVEAILALHDIPIRAAAAAA
jgi:hypothetical protein